MYEAEGPTLMGPVATGASSVDDEGFWCFLDEPWCFLVDEVDWDPEASGV